jgi:toxin FitB
MKYLLDTCVLVEAVSPAPNQKVLAWIEAQQEANIYLCAISLGEFKRGVMLLTDNEKRGSLDEWLENLLNRFHSKITNIDEETAMLWGNLQARLEQQGTPLTTIDSLVACSALRNGMILVSRDSAKYEPTGVQTINPWD